MKIHFALAKREMTTSCHNEYSWMINSCNESDLSVQHLCASDLQYVAATQHFTGFWVLYLRTSGHVSTVRFEPIGSHEGSGRAANERVGDNHSAHCRLKWKQKIWKEFETLTSFPCLLSARYPQPSYCIIHHEESSRAALPWHNSLCTARILDENSISFIE